MSEICASGWKFRGQTAAQLQANCWFEGLVGSSLEISVFPFLPWNDSVRGIHVSSPAPKLMTPNSCASARGLWKEVPHAPEPLA
jgi:hypothetical protein